FTSLLPMLTMPLETTGEVEHRLRTPYLLFIPQSRLSLDTDIALLAAVTVLWSRTPFFRRFAEPNDKPTSCSGAGYEPNSSIEPNRATNGLISGLAFLKPAPNRVCLLSRSCEVQTDRAALFA
ncbi:hypothetical protein CLAIMM_00212, partial [Cladophialophora immunda]